MRAEGCPFKGCLYFGLMLTPDGPKVIEYNCRFGDPETQVVLPLLKTDLLTVMQAVENETLAELNVEWGSGAAACVILASGGYPGPYEKGRVMDVEWNPNGSVWAVEGLTSPDGRVFGKMGHAERIGPNLYRGIPGDYDLHLFDAARDYFSI